MNKTLTLRQIEIIRAVLIAGSIAGAARLLNVTQPGISRTMKYLESTLGITLFVRKGGRYAPAPEAQNIFEQLQEIHKKLENLQFSIQQLDRGLGVELEIGSVPSIAHVMVPRAIAKLKKRFSDIQLNIELLKIEEAIDYLLLGRGEIVCMSHIFEHPAIGFEPLAKGNLVCIASTAHPIATLKKISVREIAKYPLIGIDPRDPYGSILANMFDSRQIAYDISIRARFGSTVIALVKQNLGIAVLDSFTVADFSPDKDGLAVISIDQNQEFQTYVAFRKDHDLSSFAHQFIDILRDEMVSADE